MNRILAAFSFLFIAISTFSQNIPLYNWRSHIPYLDGLQVCEVGNRIYCATQTGLFYFDRSDNTIHPLSKVDGFSDIFVKTMAYAPHNDVLIIAYQNGNIDLVHAGKISNYNQFENQFTINNIYINAAEDIAYMSLSTSNSEYGIIEFNLITDQAGTNYNPNSQPNIYRTVILGDSLYECSASGVKKVNLNEISKNNPGVWDTISTDSCANIVSFQGRIVGSFPNGLLRYYDGITNTWTTMHSDPFYHRRIQSLEALNGKLVMTSLSNQSSPYSVFVYSNISGSADSIAENQMNDAIIDEQGTIWMAQITYVLLNYKNGNTGFYQPPGLPSTTLGYHAYGYHNQVWVSAGLNASNGAPAYDNHGFYMYDGEAWHNYNQLTDYGKNDNMTGPDIRDFMGMSIDTVTGHLWIACLDSGVMEFNPATNTIVRIYDAGNTGSPGLKHSPASQYNSQVYVPVSDVKFDQSDNMFLSEYQNSSLAEYQFSEKKYNGGWATFTAGTMLHVNSLIVDNYDNIWLLDSRDNTGVVISNATNRTKFTTLGTTAGQGGLPSAYVNCGVNDKNGEIWLGTTSGPCVYSDPSLLFGSNEYDVQRPYISSGSNAGYLLASLPVTAIAVDGADRKWFGTNDGVWLTSPEGDKILKHFDMTNSALVSNQVNAIAINGVTGEVFFVTDKGIVSYRDAATDGGAKNEGVYAFPNPVRPGYNGPITIAGLVTDANVKITDVTGTLVYETTSLGGEATWNGKNFSGREANSGVYLVFITNSDGSQTAMTKILIVR